MIVVVFPLMVWIEMCCKSRFSKFALWISLFPPGNADVNDAPSRRVAHALCWQPILGIFLTLLMTLAFVFAAGRVFRIGLLVQGKSPKLGELAGWILRG